MINQTLYWNKVANEKINIAFTFCLLFFYNLSFAQNLEINSQIDSLLSINTQKHFNGIILITQNEKSIYSNVIGYSNLEKHILLSANSQFCIGSISKQFTAVLVLQEFDKGHLKLDVPIRQYLPELIQSWADTVTIHQLLTHTHGIIELDKPAAFKVGTAFSYSQIGFDLISKITERTSGKSFAQQSKELFNKCGMMSTFHPDTKEYANLVKGYTENEIGEMIYDTTSLINYAAAGAFISTAQDLILWNQNLHSGKLLKPETYLLMISKQPYAIRQHPIFGLTEYGYGITISNEKDILQLGQTGFAQGFVSMDFYFPKSKTSIVILENMAFNTSDLKKTFYYHTLILKLTREFL